MSRFCAIALFPKAKSADVVSVNDVDGPPFMGKSSKVPWIGITKQSRSPSPLPTTPTDTASLDTAFPQKVCKLLDELIARTGQIERRMATKELQLKQQVDSQRLTGGVNETRLIGREILKRIPQNVNRGDEIEYTHSVRPRTGKGSIEDDTTSLFLQAEKSMGSVGKVDFNKQICEDRLERSRSESETKSCNRDPHYIVTAAFYRTNTSTSRYCFDDDEYEM
ncbi:hypothetical protein Y032_0139g2091 [Ancylostoma ceylanicum]|uniref:Uncharacterized protein n=1 Tax=Ancylostoma ceylanicum TaxID=53326 RepID=A0A016T4R1_9BILA|nr:hypothetical protein Y032_0139g2091 [Ancylostoma ceylanicum]